MTRYSLSLLLLKVFLVVHAQSHPLNLAPAADLDDVLDSGDDLLYGSSTPSSNYYETAFGAEPTSYSSLVYDPFLPHTGSSQSSSTTMTSTISMHTTKPSQHTPTPTGDQAPATSSSTAEVSPTAFSPPGESANTNAVSRSDAKQWKIIGLVIICITFITVATLTIVFFDAWWGFLRGLVGKQRRYGQEREDMVPDWEKRSWEYKIAIPSEYPTTGSMENLTANAAGIGAGPGRARGQEMLPNPHDHPLPASRLISPQPMYMSEYGHHPLEPLSRRPSTNPRSPYA
ncbi:hypothetical protein H0H92_013104 [Tricholoma furcatifolium]|nr:hypothetical protein H0H92_013104 [Tricholoma furcatifolium]